jgi:hypothetical protein
MVLLCASFYDPHPKFHATLMKKSSTKSLISFVLIQYELKLNARVILKILFNSSAYFVIFFFIFKYNYVMQNKYTCTNNLSIISLGKNVPRLEAWWIRINMHVQIIYQLFLDEIWSLYSWKNIIITEKCKTLEIKTLH